MSRRPQSIATTVAFNAADGVSVVGWLTVGGEGDSIGASARNGLLSERRVVISAPME